MPRRTLVLVLSALVLLVVPCTAPAAVKRGVFAGSLGVTVPRGADAEVRAVNRATGTLAAAREVGRSGRFTLSLPPGSYTIVGSIVRPGARPTQVVSGVTLKSGQRRTKTNLKRKRKKPKARAAYVQELGNVTPGVVALEMPNVTGTLDGEWDYLRQGLNDLAIGDLFGDAKPDCEIAVIEHDRRAELLKELEFQQSPYVDPSTRVTRNLVQADVEVRGRARQINADRVEVTLDLIDKTTGERVGGAKRTLDGDRVFEDYEQLTKQLSEELCKLSDTYEVTLDIAGTGRLATHDGSGTMRSTLKARRANRKQQRWTDQGPIAWGNLTVTGKTPGCAHVSPVAPSTSWSVTITVAGDDTLKVDWGLGGADMATATIDCYPTSPGDYDPPPIAGQPLVSLLNTGPVSFTLPFAGGTTPITGAVLDGGDGFSNAGTLVVKPGRVVRAEG